MITYLNGPRIARCVLPPEMKARELIVNTSLGTAVLTPTADRRIRILGFHASGTITNNLTSTQRATLAFGSAHAGDPTKIIFNYRHDDVNTPLCVHANSLNFLGEVDEVVTLTNITYSVGSAVTRVIVYYTEE